MMHDGAFQYISYIYRVRSPSIPKISFLPVLEPAEKISYTGTHRRTHAHALDYNIDLHVKFELERVRLITKTTLDTTHQQPDYHT